MLRKLLSALPTVFSLSYSADYEELVAQSTADQLMRSAWARVGSGLDQAIEKVGRDVEKQKSYCPCDGRQTPAHYSGPAKQL